MLTFDNDGNVLVFSEKDKGKKKGFFKKHWKKLLAAGVGAAGLAAAGYGIHRANKEAKRRFGDEANASWLLSPALAKANHEAGKLVEKAHWDKVRAQEDALEDYKKAATKLAEAEADDVKWNRPGSKFYGGFDPEKQA